MTNTHISGCFSSKKGNLFLNKKEMAEKMKAKKIIAVLLLTTCCSLLAGSFITKASDVTDPSDTGGTDTQDPPDTGGTDTQDPAATGATVPADIAFPGSTGEMWPEIIGGSAILMEANSGTVLYAKDCHKELYPASTTKILTALLAIENSTMDQQVTFSYDSVHKTEGSSIWRDVDEVMTMEQCLYAMLLNSANECAYAIAEHVGGGYENFVAMMNERARALGCENTNFANPHGLPDEEHYTSSYDMALIAREAIKNDVLREMMGTRTYQIPPTNKHPDEITYLRNHQKMLFEGEEYYYKYCIGGKTGYTDAAGNTLVTFAEKDGMMLICVVLQDKLPGHYVDTIALLDYGFENFRTLNIAENMNTEKPGVAASEKFLPAPAFADIDGEAKIVLPKNVEFQDVKMEAVYENAGSDTAGTLQFTYAGQKVGSADIRKLETPVEQYPFGQKEEQEGEPTEEKKVVHINVWAIVLSVLGVVAVAAAVFGLYKLKDNFYLLRYKFHSRRKRDMREIVIKKKRRKRRR